ncbi:MAG: septal ring-binding cell division protein DamX [Pseudomonadales bacterium]|jgi:septal ring-binding cell division protein DamX
MACPIVMKKNIVLLALVLLTSKSLATDPYSLPGGPINAAPKISVEQLGYKSESVSGVDLSDLYTVQLAEFSVQRDAQNWVKENALSADDIGIAYVLDNGIASYIVAAGVHQGLISASDAADNFCHQNKLQGCWPRSLERLEAMAAAAEKVANIPQEISP